MSISKDELLQRRTDILADYEKATKEIEKGEAQIKTMKNNLNALGGAVQQVEMFINTGRIKWTIFKSKKST